MPIKAPPFKLCRLSEINKSLWHGRPVFSPNESDASGPKWEMEDDELPVGAPLMVKYDVGVVYEIGEEDEYGQQFTDIRFLTSDGGSLRYSAVFLWTIDDRRSE
mgnify:CR=1 FL=1